MRSPLIDATKVVTSSHMISIRRVAPDRSHIGPPQRGEFCHRHFSWLCQAGQGQCQRDTRPNTETAR